MSEPATSREAAGFCAELVRSHDFSRYASALFVPASQRRALLALYAFNVEVSRVHEQVSQPLPGEMRLLHLQTPRTRRLRFLAGQSVSLGIAGAPSTSVRLGGGCSRCARSVGAPPRSPRAGPLRRDADPASGHAV